MRRFFVPSSQINHSHAIVNGEEFHHLCHVLRLRIGDQVSLRDESGKEHHGIIASLSTTSAEITILNTAPPLSTRIPLTLALGLLKGQKMDLVIEKVTELSVDRIVPFTSAFTVSQLSTERLHDRLSRWQRIAQSAAKQSGSSIPQILAPTTLEQVCTSQLPDSTSLLFYEREQHATLKKFAHESSSGRCTVCDYWSGRWLCCRRGRTGTTQGIHILGLSSQIFRAETACMVAVTLCRFLWDEVEVPPLPHR